MFNNQIIAGAAGQGGSFYSYSIDQSLRFDGTTSNLARTHTAGDRQKFTWSGWVKFSNTTIFSLFETFAGGTDFTQFNINTNGQLNFYHVASAVDYGGDTVFRLRDPSAWYHIVWRVDTTQANAGDRVRAYVNGELRETNPFTNFGQLPQNTSTYINTARVHRMLYNQNVGGGGAPSGQANAFGNGYLSEVHFCDGQSYAPTEFGETVNGIWVAKEPSVAYGTNGFHLAFSNTSAIGDDTSGQNNDWTANNLAASDVVPDSPTNNFATWNSEHRVKNGTNAATYSEGNLKTASGGNSTHVFGSFGISYNDTQGYYWEVKAISIDTARSYVGIVAPEEGDGGNASYQFKKKFVLNRNDDFYGNDGAGGSVVSYTSWTTNDILMFAYKNGKFWIGKNGTWMNSGDPAAGTGDLVAQDGGRPSDRGNVTWHPYVGYNSTFTANFGQEGTFAGTETAGGNSDENGIGDFKYSVPSGFLALCSANLPEPTLSPNAAEQADDYFNTLLYTGNSGTLEVNGLNFQPDFLWIKRRDSAQNFSNGLLNSVTGIRKGLISNRTDAEFTSSGTNDLQSFDNDGFTIGQSNQFSGNDNGGTFVAWSWKAGGSASSNSDGSITSSVSANTDAGFSIVSYTGTGSAGATVGHGLGVVPELLIIRRRDPAEAWAVWVGGGGFSNTQYLRLNATNAVDTATTLFNSTTPTSSVVTLGSGDFVNTNTKNYIMYAFASVEGYSKVDSYVGNGNADGTFVYTGFRPAWVMIKRTDSTGSWHIIDNKRIGYNERNDVLLANSDAAEQTNYTVQERDILSNGFKMRDANAATNASGGNYIYLAFAENPFKYANAR